MLPLDMVALGSEAQAMSFIYRELLIKNQPTGIYSDPMGFKTPARCTRKQGDFMKSFNTTHSRYCPPTRCSPYSFPLSTLNWEWNSHISLQICSRRHLHDSCGSP